MFFGRSEELRQVQDFLNLKGSGLTHIRGRRRVGKSEFLMRVVEQTPHAFYFYGVDDEPTSRTISRFVKAWEKFTHTNVLGRYKKSELDWEEVFDEILRYAQNLSSPLLLAFDEVQWIAKQGSGFVGILKSSWLKLKKSDKIKLILCGSSNRFFAEKANSPTAILRGLRTYSEIWIPPFTLAEVKKYYFPTWTNEQVCLLYMMVGGIPYYLEQIKVSDNFIRSVNQSIFTKSTIFLDEIRELLNLDFSGKSHDNVITLLSFLGQAGSTQESLVKKTGLSESTLRYLLNKLMSYEIVFRKTPFGNRKTNSSGAKYYMRDFYLNFYFQILINLESRIRANSEALLFNCECLQSKRGLYIPNFSGGAFELLVENILRSKRELSLGIFKKLHLLDEAFEVSSYWNATQQVDLVVDYPGDREVRLIEVKWINSENQNIAEYVKKLENSGIPVPQGTTISRYLIGSNGLDQPSDVTRVTMIGLDDLV